MTSPSARTISLYPWIQFAQGLMFWQAIWFLYFQQSLSAAEAILLYAIFEMTVTLLEVPSGYMSDRLGRRLTLICSALAAFAALVLLALGSGFAVFALGQALLGASRAFVSGTDSALLFESLSAEGRQNEIEAQELKAWRFAFAATALSAMVGGALSMAALTLPFWASAVAMLALLALLWRCAEPPNRAVTDALDFTTLKAALLHPVLIWLFAISMLMYVFSHIPFVFGQPFILNALDSMGASAQAPLISGGVTAVMMVISLIASAFAPKLKGAIGLRPILLVAFGMQILLISVLALTTSALAIVMLFLRMVPDALSRPFILAKVQPLLADDSRATYLSLQSLSARVIFSASLWLAAVNTSDVGTMPHAEISRVLGWYVLAGLACLATLAFTAWRQAR